MTASRTWQAWLPGARLVPKGAHYENGTSVRRTSTVRLGVTTHRLAEGQAVQLYLYHCGKCLDADWMVWIACGRRIMYHRVRKEDFGWTTDMRRKWVATYERRRAFAHACTRYQNKKNWHTAIGNVGSRGDTHPARNGVVNTQRTGSTPVLTRDPRCSVGHH